MAGAPFFSGSSVTSASVVISNPEMLAAALQDNRRAVLVGQPMKGDHYERSFVSLQDGQGVVHTMTGIAERGVPRADGSAAAAGWRVRPDHEAVMDRKQQENWLEWRRDQEINRAPADAKVPEDPQLAKAVALLRAALEAAAKPGKDR